tara:strand:- start:762 stop:1205 length:444 start_codon:yes stop_codon:yes gene_type:complete
MLSVDKGFLIKNFMEDRERLGTVTYTASRGIFDKDIYGSLQSHTETQSIEESIQIIQDKEETTKTTKTINAKKSKDESNVQEEREDKIDSKKESENIYEHEVKNIILTDLLSKREKEEKADNMKSIIVTPDSLESEDDKKKRKGKKK